MHKYSYRIIILGSHYTPFVQTTCYFLSQNPDDFSPSGAFQTNKNMAYYIGLLHIYVH